MDVNHDADGVGGAPPHRSINVPAISSVILSIREQISTELCSDTRAACGAYRGDPPLAAQLDSLLHWAAGIARGDGR